MDRGLVAKLTRTQDWFTLKTKRRLQLVCFHHEFHVDLVQLLQTFRSTACELEIKCVTADVRPLASTPVVMFAVNVLQQNSHMPYRAGSPCELPSVDS
jgi:hypothetical protein